MAFPTIRSGIAGKVITSVNVATITMPANISAGDLLVLVIGASNPSTSITPATTHGTWTQKEFYEAGDGASYVGVLIAEGDEDSTTLDVTLTVDTTVSYVIVAIQDWYGDLSGVETAEQTYGSTTSTPNPPNLDPIGWGTEDTAWLAIQSGRRPRSVDVWPTNYATTFFTDAQGGHAHLAIRDSAQLASEDPGQFTLQSSTTGMAVTMAIRPASSGASTILPLLNSYYG